MEMMASSFVDTVAATATGEASGQELSGEEEGETSYTPASIGGVGAGVATVFAAGIFVAVRRKKKQQKETTSKNQPQQNIAVSNPTDEAAV